MDNSIDYSKSCWHDLKESLLKENPSIAGFNVDGEEFYLDQEREDGVTFLVLTKQTFEHYKDGLNVKSGAKSFPFDDSVMVYFSKPGSSRDFFHQYLFRRGRHYFDAPKVSELRGRFWKMDGYCLISCWGTRTQGLNKLKQFQNGIVQLFKIFGVNTSDVYIEDPSMQSIRLTEPKPSIPWEELNSYQDVAKQKISPEVEKKVQDLERKMHTADPILKKKIKSQIDHLLGGSKKTSTPSSQKSADRSSRAGFKSVAQFNHTFNSARGIDESK